MRRPDRTLVRFFAFVRGIYRLALFLLFSPVITFHAADPPEENEHNRTKTSDFVYPLHSDKLVESMVWNHRGMSMLWQCEGSFRSLSVQSEGRGGVDVMGGLETGPRPQ